MTHQNPPDHFQGKSVAAHLFEARKKGAIAMAETHGTELPGHLSAGADAAKETAIFFLIIWATFPSFLFLPFGLGLVIWKTGRSALIGWNRLERLHRLIEEERFEIQHHREQEKQELKEMYQVKGLAGKLLDEVVNILMADDNRLLRVMLEEELGLSLEIYEHPLKQAFGAFSGTLISATTCILAHYFWPTFGLPLLSLLIIIICANMAAKYERRSQLTSVIWNFALSLLAAGAAYFLARLIQ